MNLYCRNKTGILGWRSEKMETVNGYDTKVEYKVHTLTVLSPGPEKPPLSELNLILPETPLHLKCIISPGYFKTWL